MLKYKIISNQYHNVKEVLSNHFHISNRLLTKLKKGQKIFLNGKSVYVTTPVDIDDLIEVDIDFEEESENIVPVKMDLDIIYEDEYLLIVNKSSNLPVHPSILHFEDSLSNGIAYYFQSNNINRKIRPVNRLDKDTSGIVIFAKNEYVQECLIKQMKQNIFIKHYLAILEGHLEKDSGTISAPIARKENSIIERVVSPDGASSVTHFKVINRFELTNKNNILKLSLVEFKLETGRTHQIRVHSQYVGHPILGDSLYGKDSHLIARQALHAYKISFIHPITEEKLYFETILPYDIKNLLEK